MNPVLLQKQLKDNASDLHDFYNDLKAWGADMKRKEESRQKINDTSDKKRKVVPSKKETTVTETQKPKPQGAKVAFTDYAAWEKFDVDAECEKVDYNENEESDLTDEYDDSARDQAYIEKDKGNKFVKDKNWDEAITCYTKAINCYSYDPIFYANRALCYLKKELYFEAESDCTKSLKLDQTYVKAFLRRAAAKEAQNKLNEAETDFLRVLELEPKNTEAKTNLNNLRKKLVKTEEVVQRPVSKFTMSRNKKGIKSLNVDNSKTELASINNNNWSNEENIILVKTINKQPHLQSKKPLKRIEINEIVELNDSSEKLKPFPRNEQQKTSFKTDDLHVVEKQQSSPGVQEKTKENKNQTNNMKMNETNVELVAPSNSVQFFSIWRQLKSIENKYKYLKLIKPENLSKIFKESLECDVLSQILEVLVNCFIKNEEDVYNYLVAFSKMRRFSTIVMFMSDNDKNYVRKLFDYVKMRNGPLEDVEELFKKYEL